MPTGLLHALAVVIVAALVVLIYRRTGHKQVQYNLSQPWTHAPILWAAVDEVVPGSGHHSGHGGHGEDVTVGGGASGRW